MDNSNVKNIWNNWSETWYQKYRTEEVITKIKSLKIKSLINYVTGN